MALPARDVATRMRAIEDNVTGETGEDAPALDRVVATLLDVEYDGLDAVMLAECRRVLDLIDGWYRQHGLTRTPDTVAALAFVQGVTFAVAAQRAHDDSGRSITCPRCGMTSHHPTDIREGYCGQCHDWTMDADRG